MTNIIWRILIAEAAEATKPTAPTRDNNITNITGWTSLGATSRGDDGNLDADSIEVAFFDEYGHIMPPVAMAKADSVPMQNGVDSFSFVAYDISQAVMALASDMTFSGNVGTKTQTSIKRSVVIEFNGVGYLYFPRVELKLPGLVGGIAAAGAGKTKFFADCCEGVTLPAGFSYTEYQAG